MEHQWLDFCHHHSEDTQFKKQQTITSDQSSNIPERKWTPRPVRGCPEDFLSWRDGTDSQGTAAEASAASPEDRAEHPGAPVFTGFFSSAQQGINKHVCVCTRTSYSRPGKEAPAGSARPVPGLTQSQGSSSQLDTPRVHKMMARLFRKALPQWWGWLTHDQILYLKNDLNHMQRSGIYLTSNKRLVGIKRQGRDNIEWGENICKQRFDKGSIFTKHKELGQRIRSHALVCIE